MERKKGTLLRNSTRVVIMVSHDYIYFFRENVHDNENRRVNQVSAKHERVELM